MHKNATKCNEILSKWCKNKHGASKIMDTLETYEAPQAVYLNEEKVILVPSIDGLWYFDTAQAAI
jgi:hypothetical protein